MYSFLGKWLDILFLTALAPHLVIGVLMDDDGDDSNSTASNQTSSNSLQVISLNVWKDTPIDFVDNPAYDPSYQSFDNSRGKKRKAALEKFIAAHRNETDVFLLQEMSPAMHALFTDQLGDVFAKVPGDEGGEQVIYFRKRRLNLVQSTESSSAPAIIALLSEAGTRSPFLLASVHAACDCGERTVAKVEVRKKQMKAVGEDIRRLVGHGDVPMLLGGDLNDHDRAVVEGCLDMKIPEDFLEANATTYPTDISVEKGTLPCRYDWFASSGLASIRAKVYTWKDTDGLPVSDHQPLLAVVSLPDANETDCI